jgi:hypothetical protein
MAGNIIPAIATTNAMTASLCVLQSFKVLQDDISRAKMVRDPVFPQFLYWKLNSAVHRRFSSRGLVHVQSIRRDSDPLKPTVMYARSFEEDYRSTHLQH